MESAFCFCVSLDNVIIGNCVTSIGDHAFYSTDLKNLIFPDGMAKIGNWAFYSISVSYIYIPKNIEFIGGAAFNDISVFGVYFGGTEAEWNSIEIDYAGNSELYDVNIVYFGDSN